MSVDDRLRDGLARNAAAFRPDVELRLGQVRTRTLGRRPHAFSGRLWAPVAAACAVIAVVATLLVIQLHRTTQQPSHVLPTHGRGQSLSGRLRTMLPDTAGVLRDQHLTGRWVIALAPDGTMQVTGPSRYHGVLSAALFDSTSTEFRTSLFSQDLCSGMPLGRYTWQRSGHSVQFRVADDPCSGRVAMLTEATWRIR